MMDFRLETAVGLLDESRTARSVSEYLKHDSFRETDVMKYDPLFKVIHNLEMAGVVERRLNPDDPANGYSFNSTRLCKEALRALEERSLE